MAVSIKALEHRKQQLLDILLWCMLLALTALSAGNIAAMRQYSAVSLRYETPFSGQAAYKARQYCVEQGGEDAFWPTFWREDEVQISAEHSKVTARCILFSGNASLVWPAEYLSGGAPGVIDDAGCSVSSGLAWALWGDAGAHAGTAGKSIEIDGETRTVRGVFEEEEPLVLLSLKDEDQTQRFTAVELAGGPSVPSRSEVEDFAAASGLGKADTVLMGTPSLIAELLAAAPLLLLACYGLALCLGRLKKRPAALRGMVVFLACVGAAALLPVFLNLLPDWVIPSKWSDFSFWSALFGQTGKNLREYLTPVPCARDAGYSLLFFKQAGIAVLLLGSSLTICVRLHGKTRHKTNHRNRRINHG